MVVHGCDRLSLRCLASGSSTLLPVDNLSTKLYAMSGFKVERIYA